MRSKLAPKREGTEKAALVDSRRHRANRKEEMGEKKGVTATNRTLTLSKEYRLTNGEAVGPSRIASSSLVNGKRGIRKIRRGTSNMIMTGNPIAAMRRR